MSSDTYGYYINLNERGEFYADVRDAFGNTHWEIHTEQAHELVEDGFLKDPASATEVGRYLVDEVEILPAGATLMRGVEFDHWLEANRTLIHHNRKGYLTGFDAQDKPLFDHDPAKAQRFDSESASDCLFELDDVNFESPWSMTTVEKALEKQRSRQMDADEGPGL